MNFKFGSKSRERLLLAHDDIRKIFNLAIKRTKVDFGISETFRLPEIQKEYFDKGLSKCDGYTIKSKHNQAPSLAIDIFAYVKGKASYKVEELSYIAGLIDSCAEELYERREITHLIRWGGNWDRDGEIFTDQGFDDSPHFELIKP